MLLDSPKDIIYLSLCFTGSSLEVVQKTSAFGNCSGREICIVYIWDCSYILGPHCARFCVFLRSFEYPQDCLGGAQLLAEQKPLLRHYFLLSLQLQVRSNLKSTNREVRA